MVKSFLFLNPFKNIKPNEEHFFTTGLTITYISIDYTVEIAF